VHQWKCLKLCKRSFDIFFSTRISVSALASWYIWTMEWCSTLTLTCWPCDCAVSWRCTVTVVRHSPVMPATCTHFYSSCRHIGTKRSAVFSTVFFIVFYVLRVKDRKVQNSGNCWDWNQSVWWFRACCRNARLTTWSAKRWLTLTVRLNRCRVSRSSVNFN